MNEAEKLQLEEYMLNDKRRIDYQNTVPTNKKIPEDILDKIKIAYKERKDKKDKEKLNIKPN